MFNVVYCEFLKLKQLKLPLIILICIITSIVIGHANSGYSKMIILNNYFQVVIYINWIIFAILFSLITGRIFSNEYKNNTIKNMFCYPMSRAKLFGAKIIALMCIIIVVYLLSLTLSLISLLFVKHELLSKELILSVFRAYVISMIGSICFMALIASVCIFTEKITTPLILSIISILYLFIFSSSADNSKWIYFCPATSQLQLSLRIMGEEKIPMEMIYSACIGLIISLVVGCVFSILIFNKRDVR
ncbi:MAG: ABC transporter permease [Clostridium cochlearium]|uniref:ABC transporter permease n=2 Tax=Clostridium TaxID=1485 RepID=A0A2X2WB93_CLOCO|nr:ABC transporter permease [Clostridium cochlearium]MBU5269707.1 ABC transporter permease [Clostridium cochlearium]MDU1442946.1 ABC transporter permease [Clostridium cochlearium]SQB36727.1 ABC transporter permease [Clostridium cochlearium]